jgi:hypothetical protein
MLIIFNPGKQSRAFIQGAAGQEAAPLEDLGQGAVPQGRALAQLFAHFQGAAGHHRPEQRGDMAQAFQQMVEDRIQAGGGFRPLANSQGAEATM